jgi:hypothetical protein
MGLNLHSPSVFMTWCLMLTDMRFEVLTGADIKLRVV